MQNYDLIYFFKQFPDDLSCRKYLERRFWGNVPVCPYCHHTEKIYRYKNGKTFKCACCQRQFKVTTGTIYEDSNIPLQSWFITSYLLAVSKKGISSIELSKVLGVTQKTAWYLLHKIRYAMEYGKSKTQLSDNVEIDETYVGGKMKGGKRGRGSENKTPVFGIKQRKGDLYITPVEDTKRKTLEPIIFQKVETGTTVNTDELNSYAKLGLFYKHCVVNHGRKEYVRGDIHTNSIEGAWSHLKRSMMGTYHRPSKRHLAKYCAEFEHCFNTRDFPPQNRFQKSIDRNNVRVKYKDIA